MSDANTKRVMILEWENLTKTIGRINIKSIRESDYFYIFRRDAIELPDNIKKTIAKLEGKYEVYDCHELPMNSYVAFINAKIRTKINKDTFVYFIGCPSIYSQIETNVKSISADAVCVANIMQLKIQQKPTDKQVDDELNDLADALDDLNIPNDIPFNHDSPKKQEQKTGNFAKKEFEKTDRKPEKNPQSRYDSNKNKETDRRNKEFDSKQKSKEKISSTTVEAPVQHSNTDQVIKALEKKIFSDAVIEQDLEREYTELDDNKVRTLMSTFNRLVEHLNLTIDNASELTEDDYTVVIMQLIKSPSLEDFNQCKEILNFRANILLNLETFTIFKKEADYYIKMCDLFYKEDKW